ncbi:MAG: alpha/beta fold hydrolase [Anaerolineae bacterium]
MPTFHTDGVGLYYESHGSGPAVVFTHGAALDHAQWQPQIEALAPEYQVVVWDVRGHGRSTLPSGPVDPDAFSRDLIALLDHLAIPQTALCGLSMGGHIALQTAARWPSRCSALILIGTPCTNAFNAYERIVVPMNRFSQRILPMPTLARWTAAALGGRNLETRTYIEQTMAAIPHEQWVRLWHAVTSMESRDELGRIACPTLILEAEGDTLIHRQQVYMAAHIPGAEHRMVPGAGHATTLDNPAEVNSLIRAFLQAQGWGGRPARTF